MQKLLLLPKSIEIKENELSDFIEITSKDKEYLEKLKEEKWKIETEYDGNKVKVRFNGIVGTIQLTDKRIYVTPKIDIENVIYMLSIVYNFKEFELIEPTVYSKDKDLLELLVYYLLLITEKLFKSGIHKNYIAMEDDLNFIRGKILIKENIKHNPILRHKIYCQYDEFTEDIPENQLIKYTLYHLLKANLSDELKTIEYRVISYLDDVSILKFPTSYILEKFDKIVYTRLNEEYKDIHELCKLFLQNLSIKEEYGRTIFSAFLIDMSKLFEKFVFKILEKEIRNSNSQPKKTIECIDGLEKIDITLNPDILIKSKEKNLVIDTKYKNPLTKNNYKEEIMINSDIYQIISYSSVFNAKGILIYPKNDIELEEYYKIEEKNIEFIIITIDLSGNKETFKKNCEKFCKKIQNFVT